MTDPARIEQLELKLAQAYQVIGALLSGPDGKCTDFDSEQGQRALDYFGGDEVRELSCPLHAEPVREAALERTANGEWRMAKEVRRHGSSRHLALS